MQGLSYDGNHDQVEWEHFWRATGIQKYFNKQENLKQSGTGTLTDSGSNLVKQFLEPAAKHFAEQVQNRRGNSVEAVAMRQIHPEVAAYLALKIIINETMRSKEGVKRTSVSFKIGNEIEKEQKALYLEKEGGELLNWYTWLMEHDTTKPVWYRNNKVEEGLKIINKDWLSWSKEVKITIGTRLLYSAEVAGMVVNYNQNMKNKRIGMTKLSEEVVSFINNTEDYLSGMFAVHMPLIEKPKQWSCLFGGGYYTARMSEHYPLIKSRGYQVKELMKTDMPQIYEAANKLQSVKFEVNRDVLDVAMKLRATNALPDIEMELEAPDFPFDKDWRYKEATVVEQERYKEWNNAYKAMQREKNKHDGKLLEFNACVSIAREMVKQEDRLGFRGFYYAWQTDFRGRFYPNCTVLSPQGSDIHKGLLRFAEKKPLGEYGARALSIHGAGVYGVDKVSLDDRIQWCEDNTDAILACAEDPIGNKDFLLNADKPFQFLAFCYEWAGFQEYGDNFMSALPCASDGSCNGIQHYSAALKDEVGGRSTNLIPNNVPNDVYMDVANVLLEKLEKEDDPYATKLLEAGIGRKMTKRQVMTLPYGSTLYSCREYTLEHLNEAYKDVFPTIQERIKVAHYLSPLLWQSINKVVIKAREAMDWLRDVAKYVSKEGAIIDYTTPSGFRVYYTQYAVAVKKLHIRIEGKQKSLALSLDKDKINGRKVANSVAPNFVHSLDATHLTWTVNALPEGTSLSMVHDSYATHACDFQLLNDTLREQFVKLYTDYDVLNDFKSALEREAGVALPDLPSKGSMDVHCVLNSEYFFA